MGVLINGMHALVFMVLMNSAFLETRIVLDNLIVMRMHARQLRK